MYLQGTEEAAGLAETSLASEQVLWFTTYVPPSGLKHSSSSCPELPAPENPQLSPLQGLALG